MAFTMFTDDGGKFTWHVPGRKPKFHKYSSAEKHIVLLQADGDELELIKARMINVPYCHQITTWRGDMAQFIYDNL